MVADPVQHCVLHVGEGEAARGRRPQKYSHAQALDEGMSTASTVCCIDFVWLTYTLHIALCLQIKVRNYLLLVIHNLVFIAVGQLRLSKLNLVKGT